MDLEKNQWELASPAKKRSSCAKTEGGKGLARLGNDDKGDGCDWGLMAEDEVGTVHEGLLQQRV